MLKLVAVAFLALALVAVVLAMAELRRAEMTRRGQIYGSMTTPAKGGATPSGRASSLEAGAGHKHLRQHDVMMDIAQQRLDGFRAGSIDWNRRSP